jgi:hypothetical protein
MAAITITPANVLPGAGATYQGALAGESVTAGQPVYVKAADGKLYKADANASAEAAAAVGIAAHASLAGQRLSYYTGGTVAFGAVLTVGEVYYVGAAGGDIVPSADVVAGWYVTRLGIATSTGNLLMDLNATGVQK